MCITFGNPSDPCCDDAAATRLPGTIFRLMQPVAVEDYAGLSTATWQAAVIAGNQSLFHHFTSPNTLTTSRWDILSPVRWSPASPADDGGRYDYFNEGFSDTVSHQSAVTQIRRALLPANWHARFINGTTGLIFRSYVEPRMFPNEVGESVFGSRVYADAYLQSIAPSVPIWGSSPPYNIPPAPAESFVYAVQLRMNGLPVGPLLIDPDGAELSGIADVRFRPGQNDNIEFDVWYRIGIEAGLGNASAPGKGCVTLAQYNATTGSNRGLVYHAEFSNVDFSPEFNPSLQTFEISAAGHTGWKLLDDSNGPHRMESSGGFGSPFYGEMFLAAVPEYAPAIRLRFGQEVAEIVIEGGSLNGRTYRPVANPQYYRKSVFSLDFGEINDAACGPFFQSGTTVFELVPDLPALAGRPSPPIPREVPRRFVVTRVSR